MRLWEQECNFWHIEFISMDRLENGLATPNSYCHAPCKSLRFDITLLERMLYLVAYSSSTFSDFAATMLWRASAPRWASSDLNWNISASAFLSRTMDSSSSICCFFLCFSNCPNQKSHVNCWLFGVLVCKIQTNPLRCVWLGVCT